MQVLQATEIAFRPRAGRGPSAPKYRAGHVQLRIVEIHRIPQRRHTRTSRARPRRCTGAVTQATGSLPCHPHEAGNGQGLGQPEVTSTPARVADPSNTGVSGEPRSALVREDPHRGPTTVTHSSESSTPSPLTETSCSHRIASPTTHRGGRPTRARGNRGHPSPLYEGSDPSGTEVPGGPRSASSHEEIRRRTDDRDPSGPSDGAERSLYRPSSPTAAAELTSHERCRGSLQRKAQNRGSVLIVARSAACSIPEGYEPLRADELGPRNDRRFDAHRSERFIGDEDRIRRSSPITSPTRAKSVSITRTFNRAVRSVSPPRDFITPGAVEDQTQSKARTCCVQLSWRDG